VAKLDPARYRAMVLEYEIGSALWELAHEHQDGHEEAPGQGSPGQTAPGHHEEEPGCCAASGFIGLDFIESALKEIHAEYGAAAKLHDEGKLDEARAALKPLAGKVDPYVAAYSSLRLAEVEHALASAGGGRSGHEKVLSICERLGRDARMYLVTDHRACELIALSLEKLGKPLHEAVQYMLLLTDYNDLPKEVGARAQARLAALEGVAQAPLGTVGSWMDQVEGLLEKEITAKDPTQSQELEIVSGLDKLIELQEARERKT
jgi:hypothetical protein